ncbi:MAG: TetR/AcrR family transcriptional regulator [Deltaproteobacteria bacterium]|nr:MAG: TetR/AcrR family transcriptional regulator [Deltaproteobacteria bacterium]
MMNIASESPAGPRAQRRQKNLARILDAAMDAIAVGGFDALSMNKLAASLDYTPGALYRYFPSKDALVLALVETVIEEIGQDLARLEDVPADAPLARIVAGAEAWRGFSTRAPNRFGLVSMLLAAPQLIVTDEARVSSAMGTLLVAVRPVAAAIEAAAQRGALAPGDAIERTLLLFASINGVLQLKKQAPRAPQFLDLDRLFTAMLRTLLLGWGAPAATVTSLLPA